MDTGRSQRSAKERSDLNAASSGTVRVRGADLSYHRVGTAGPDVVWGHGLSQSRAAESLVGLIDWSTIRAQVVRYDARGHGESESTPDPRAYGWDELAADQLALANALGVVRYIAAGASMGCGTALHAAVVAPDRVERLVLVIPPTAWETRAAQSGEWERVAVIVEEHGVEPVIAARAGQPLPDPLANDPEARDRQAAVTRAWDVPRLARVMRGATYADLPSRANIARIGVPTMILAWSGDPVHPVSTANELHDLIPGSVLHIATTADDLAGWNALVADFITST